MESPTAALEAAAADTSLQSVNNNNHHHHLDAVIVLETDDARTRHWKQSYYAVGRVNMDWTLSSSTNNDNHDGTNHNNNRNRDMNDTPPNFCTMLSSIFCRCAGRLGNMVVLWDISQTSKDNNNNNNSVKKRYPLVMLGPFWPMMMCVTYPLILGISAIVAWRVVPRMPFPLFIAWCIGTGCLLLSLTCVACSNPGIMPRYLEIPTTTNATTRTRTMRNHHNTSTTTTTTTTNDDWIWNDQALTYRPLHAKYDSTCAVVVQHYDHVCPWTGTAIGQNNMMAFRCFVLLVFLMIMFNISLVILPSILLLQK